MARKSIKRKGYRSKRAKIGERRRIAKIIKWGILIWVLGLLFFYWRDNF